ncbi:MAG: hypothetical protein EHM20_03145 [Alphaproteobacteria bacterium]|nr:MAG: hypothetical protein EHM20_03145 [Alphaproteobacteria bacterium]
MFLPSFRHLIEIEALKKQNQQNLAQISSENKRISDLDERRKKTLLHIENLKLEEKNLHLSETLGNLGSHESRYKKLNEQLSLAATEKEQMAFENQIQLEKNEIQKFESIYFENLEKSEAIQLDIKTNKEFFEGSANSLEEIKIDVEKNISNEQKSIDNRNQRIQSLMEQIHPNLQSLYLELEKKFKPKSPVSFLIDKKCSECHMQTDSILKNSLEEGRSIETCPACSRLLIPETAKIY